jgi:hypothetical protein
MPWVVLVVVALLVYQGFFRYEVHESQRPGDPPYELDTLTGKERPLREGRKRPGLLARLFGVGEEDNSTEDAAGRRSRSPLDEEDSRRRDTVNEEEDARRFYTWESDDPWEEDPLTPSLRLETAAPVSPSQQRAFRLRAIRDQALPNSSGARADVASFLPLRLKPRPSLPDENPAISEAGFTPIPLRSTAAALLRPRIAPTESRSIAALPAVVSRKRPYATAPDDLNADGQTEDIIQTPAGENILFSVVSAGREVFTAQGRQLVILPSRHNGWADLSISRRLYRYNPQRQEYQPVAPPIPDDAIPE